MGWALWAGAGLQGLGDMGECSVCETEALLPALFCPVLNGVLEKARKVVARICSASVWDGGNIFLSLGAQGGHHHRLAGSEEPLLLRAARWEGRGVPSGGGWAGMPHGLVMEACGEGRADFEEHHSKGRWGQILESQRCHRPDRFHSLS